MTFFYDLNKRLDGIRANPETTHGQLNERDEGKPGKNFAKIAKDAGERYGSKAAGERVAGAVRNKLRAQGKLEEQDMDESAFQAAIGKKKYGDEGMKALQKAGRDHASDTTMDKIRNKYDKYDEGAYQGGPDKSQIPAVQRKNDPMTLRDLEKERTQSPTSPEGMRALQDKLKNIHPLDEKMSDSQASDFAALAPPKDKITFADKIAGAKKEVDEMLGDVAAEAMKKAVGKHMEADMDEGNDFTGARLAAIRAGKPSFKVGGKSYRVSGDTSQERGMGEGRHSDDEDDVYAYQDDTKKKSHKTASGGTVTRHGGVTRHQAAPGHYGGYDPETDPDKDDDKPGTPAGEKRGRGRPAGTKKATGAKGPSGKSKLMKKGSIKEDDMIDPADRGEYDYEGDMALDDIDTIQSAANELQSIIDANENLPEWVQSKINKAMDYLDTARDYMAAQGNDQEMDEVAPPGAKAERMVKGIKKSLSKDGHLSGKDKAIAYATTWKAKKAGQVEEESTDKEDQKAEKAGKKVAKDIEHDEGHKGKDDNRAEKAGKKVTKDIEYDDKKDRKEKKKEEVDETTVAGSVAPAMGGTAKGKGGMTFGKGVYEAKLAESFEQQLKQVMNEGMSISANQNEDGTKSLTVNATEDDAMKLAEILKMAGLGGNSSGYEKVCPGCGSSDCGCDHVEEDTELANSADDTVYADTDYMVNGLSGGLNGRKTDQSTLPVLNQDPRRTVGSVAESNDVVELYKRIA